MRIRLILLASVLCGNAVPCLAQEYKVIYTGRLLGQFRYPGVQKLDEKVCPASEPGDADVLVKTFGYGMNKLDPHHRSVRVAVGDTFAPFFLSRLIYDKNAQTGGRWIHKEQFEFAGSEDKWVRFDHLMETDETALINGNGQVPVDNVGCFLRWVQFDAIVPGPHDFYFGVERLRELKEFLESSRLPAFYRPVRVLGSNLTTRTVAITDGQPASDKLPSIGNNPYAPPQPEPVIPPVVLAWMRAVRVKNAIAITSTRASDAVSLPKFSDDDQDCFRTWLATPSGTPPAGRCTANDLILAAGPETYTLRKNFTSVEIAGFSRLIPASYSRIGTSIDFWIDHPLERKLLPTGSHSVIVVKSGTPVQPVPFKVEPSFLESSGETPWVSPPSTNGSVAVFGVVDGDMGQLVGRLNSTWMARKSQRPYDFDDKVEMELHFSDPAEALAQVVQYCYMYPGCWAQRKVVLASMSQSKVYDLLAELRSEQILTPPDLRFDLMIAAADPSRPTGMRELDYPLTEIAPPVLVPTDHASRYDAYTLEIKLQTATVKESSFDMSIRNTEDKVGPGELIENGSFDPKGGASKVQTLAKWLNMPAGVRSTYFLEQIALERMSKTCNAGISLLQHRDVFWSDKMLSAALSPDGLFAIVNAIFWKGDLIHCGNFPGSAITTALQTSSTLQNQQDLGLTGGLSKGWSLAERGIASGQKSQTPVVRGQYLDAKALYPVAATDYIAYGDTGYASFKGAEPDPDPPLHKQQLLPLADIIADYYLRLNNEPPPDRHLLTVLSGATFLDARIPMAIDSPPPPPKDTFGAWVKRIGDDDELKGFSRPGSKRPDREMKAQQQPYYSVDLYKMDASYNLFAHNGSEAAVGTSFPGVSSIDVTPADSSSLSFDYIVRAQRTSGRKSLYIQSELSYGNKALRQAGGAYTRSETSNFSYQEVGLALNFKPAHQNPSGWKTLFPISIQSQVVPPVFSVPFPAVTPSLTNARPPCPAGSIAVNGSCTETTPQTVTAPHSYYVAFRPGFRFDYVFPKPDTTPPGGAAGGAGGGVGGGSGSVSSGSGGKGPNVQVAPSTYNTYLEFGYEGGPQLNGTKAFESEANHTPAPGGNCDIYGDIGACVLNQVVYLKTLTGQPPITVSALPGRTHFQDGMYLNFRVDMPVPFAKKYELVVQNRGDFFLPTHRDSRIDTRFYDDLLASFIVPVYGHLSFSASFELQLFENKINYSLYRSTSSFASLSYGFDWRSGLHWRDLWKFSNPTPPLTSLPNR